MANVTMTAADTISGKMGECYITIRGNRYNFAQVKDISAKIEKKKVEVGILGKPMAANRSVGSTGSGSAKFYYNTSIIREMLIDYSNTGEDVYFELQMINDDPTSSAGRQEVILYDCNVNDGIIAKLNVDEEVLEDEFEFTFDSCKMPKKFNIIESMKL